MKKIFLILALLGMALFTNAQVVTDVFDYGHAAIITDTLDSTRYVSDVSYTYFSFKNNVSAYAIQAIVADTFEDDSTIAILQGSNYLGEWTAIDTLDLPNAQATFTTPKVIIGTTAPYGVYRFAIPTDSLNDGKIQFLIHYY